MQRWFWNLWLIVQICNSEHLGHKYTRLKRNVLKGHEDTTNLQSMINVKHSKQKFLNCHEHSLNKTTHEFHVSSPYLATLFIIPKMKGAWQEIYTRLLVLHCLESPLIWPSQTKPLLTEIGIHLTLESCDIQTKHKAGKKMEKPFPIFIPDWKHPKFIGPVSLSQVPKKDFPFFARLHKNPNLKGRGNHIYYAL